jgi:menaquinone-9 beta-reductase
VSAGCGITGALVVGGGLAGSMLAMRLSAAGREVTLLEKERCAHHKVCGEFLSREAVEYLREADIHPLKLGASSIHSVRLSVKRKQVEARLPFAALSISRYVLDEALLARAAERGCRVERGAGVEGLSRHDGAWLAELRDGSSWRAETVFLANGKHDLRGMKREQGKQGDMVGFKLHWRLAPAQTQVLRGFMELFLFRGGYGGLSLVEGDAANLCLVVRRGELRRLAGWNELLASIRAHNEVLRERLEGAAALWDRPLAVTAIPYGHLAGRSDGLWCVGDQAAVIPSFTGDGMSIALHSAAVAARMYLAGDSADAYHQRLRAQLKPGMGLATLLSRAMMSGVGRWVAPVGLAVFPGAIEWIARSTRIPEAPAVGQTLA